MTKEWFPFYWIHLYSWKFKGLFSFSRENRFWNCAGCRAVQWLGYFQQRNIPRAILWIEANPACMKKTPKPTKKPPPIHQNKHTKKPVKSHLKKYNRNPKQFAVGHPLLNGHFPIYHHQTFSSDRLHFIAGNSSSVILLDPQNIGKGYIFSPECPLSLSSAIILTV